MNIKKLGTQIMNGVGAPTFAEFLDKIQKKAILKMQKDLQEVRGQKIRTHVDKHALQKRLSRFAQLDDSKFTEMPSTLRNYRFPEGVKLVKPENPPPVNLCFPGIGKTEGIIRK